MADNPDNYYSLEKLTKLLSPITLQSNTSNSGVTKVSIHDQIKDVVMDPRGVFKKYSDMHKAITDHFNKGDKAEKEALKKEFHLIGSAQPGPVDFGDADYWGNKVKAMSDIVPSVKPGVNATNQGFEASAFVIRSPYVTPAARGVDVIDVFLNNTPPIIASQLMPYLDVEFELRRTYSNRVTTPSLLRFLIGSGDTSSAGKQSQIDIIMDDASLRIKDNVASAFSGMEMFLAPQTLTNMDGDGVYSMKNRLVKQKPFVPFASLEGFDISVQNAGAGKFAHRKGTLKLKIHDKGRLSEMSDFLRPQGYHQALIWITFGWLAPNRFPHGAVQDEDEYVKFINDNMLVRECWSVVNTQFGFDGSGQMQLTLELLTRGSRVMQKLFVTGGDDMSSVKNSLDQFEKAIKAVHDFVAKNSGNPKFSLPATAMQVLNEAASTGVFTNIKQAEVAKAIENIIRGMKGTGIDQTALTELQSNLASLNGKYSYENVRKQVNESVARRLNSFGDTSAIDPFLPSESKKDYWDSEVIDAMKQFTKTVEERKKKLDDRKKLAKGGNQDAKKQLQETIEIQNKATVVSFGKLFMSFVAPEVRMSDDCDELQVYFYALNDQCGPISGHSIAEFPIDVNALAYAYAEALKVMKTDRLTIESFLRVVIESQFTDQRAPAYGMGQFFKPHDKDRPTGTAEKPDDKKAAEAAEKGLSEWMSKYGKWQPPMIEMIIETGEEGMPPTNVIKHLKRSALLDQQALEGGKPRSKSLIKRIHIYDKQCNPYKLLKSVIRADNGDLELGFIDETKLRSRTQQLVDGLQEAQKNKLAELINAGKNFVDALKDVGGSADPLFDVVKRPGGDKIALKPFKASPQVLREQVKRFVPSITIGANGTMVMSANASSKTDGTQGAINIMRSHAGNSSGKPTVFEDGLQNSNGLPLTILPMQLNMSTMGVPTMQLYQTFFVDFGTGTSIDNLYSCTQIQHSISSGKFISNLTFMYTDGYAKFGNPPSLNMIISGQVKNVLKDALELLGKQKPGAKPKAAAAPKK